MENKSFTGYNPTLKSKSRRLRKDMTKQEKHLWYDFLRTYPVKFYRQRSVGEFIVDFYCSKAQLAVELDGSQHYSEQGETYDNFRTQKIKEYGIEVLRFSNLDIDTNFRGVCLLIGNIVKERI